MRYWKQVTPALLVLALAACGGDSKNNDTKNNTTNNTTANNTTVNNTSNNTTVNNTTDACAAKTCPQLNDVCVGDVAVTYDGEGVCEATSGDCDYGAVEIQTNCADNGQSCRSGACVDIDDLCGNVTCDSPPLAPSCDAATAVTYGNGICDGDTGMCDYGQAEIRTNCLDNGEICVAGACVAATPEPNPGELVITEFMANPAAVGDGVGEWFEVYNATARELDINGLTIIDDGGDSFAIPAGTAMLPADGYLVFGINDDTTTNGGVTVDIVYDGITLANSGDELVIVDANAVEIDRVAWDSGNGWIIASGSSNQVGLQYDLLVEDNNDPQFWCGAPTAFGDGDFGSPGAPNEACAGPVTVTLYQLSNDQDADYPGVNSLVNVFDVAITAIDTTEGYIWMQETAGGEYSGIYVDAGSVDVSGLSVGDIVDISGSYDEWNGDLARITATSITDSGIDMTIAPTVLESSVLRDDATAEPWENVLVQVNEVGVTDDNFNNFGDIEVDGKLLVDDLLYDGFATSAADCQVYEFVVGPLNYAFGAFKIEPRDANDVGAMTVATAVTAVGAAGFAFTPAAICVTVNDTVTWANTDAAPHTVTSRLASMDMTGNLPATPLFDEPLPAAGTATVTFANPGTFHYRCRPHGNMEGVVVVPTP